MASQRRGPRAEIRARALSTVLDSPLMDAATQRRVVSVLYWGFVDTTVSSGSYYFFQPPAFVNQYAAMPSMHFGWSLLAAVAIFANLRSPYRYVALLMPVATLGGVVLTANHFFLDAAAGAAVALLGLWIAVQLRNRLPRSKPFSVLA